MTDKSTINFPPVRRFFKIYRYEESDEIIRADKFEIQDGVAVFYRDGGAIMATADYSKIEVTNNA